MTRNNWIRAGESTEKNSVAYFRKTHAVKETPKSITVLVSAHNHLNFYLNGKCLTGYVSPAPTCVPENIYYLSYTLEGAELSEILSSDGKCLAFAARVHYKGDSGASYINGVPAFWAEIEIRYANGVTETVKTDTTWRALSETPYKNGTPSVNSRRNNAQIDYDARKMPDPDVWTAYDYNEASYEDGTWRDAIPAEAETAEWKMRPQKIPEGKLHGTFTPIPIARQETGWQVFDAGQLVSGWVRIRTSAPEGTRIRIRYSEYLEGDVVSTGVGSTKQKSENYCDFYTFSGNGVESFAADLDYRAFRYFEVTGLDHLLSPEELTVEWVSTGITQSAKFSSSDDFLTSLYQICINTQINNVQGMPVDCPHREQSQYLADSQLQYALISYAFEEYAALSYKTLLDFASSQLESGRFTFTAPTEAYKSKAAIPEWDLRYTRILYGYYQKTKDLESTAVFYEAATRNAEYYLKKLNKEGLLEDDPIAWNISDHPVIKHVPDDPGAGIAPTAVNLLLFDTLNLLSELAAVLGKDGESADWSAKAELLKKNINGNLLNTATGMYYQHSDTTLTNTGLTAMAINTGVATPYYLDKELRLLTNTQITDTSIVLTYEIFRAVMDHGNAEQKNSIYERMKKHWGPMVEKGTGTVWEGFLDQSSHSHAWSGYPAYFLLKDFLGVEGLDGKTPSVVPFLPEKVSAVEGSVMLQKDVALKVRLERKDGYELTLDAKDALLEVAVPRTGKTNTVVYANGVKVFEKGKGIDAAEGIQYLGEDAEYVYFRAKITEELTFVSVAEEKADRFFVSVEQSEGGKVVAKCGGVEFVDSVECDGTNQIELTATPEEGYAFLGWHGSMGASEARLSITPDSETLLIPIFERREGKVVPIRQEETVPEPEGEPVSSSSAQEGQTSIQGTNPLLLTLIVILILLVPLGIFLGVKFGRKKK
ncbi:MAG: family 78 glycoside hydrolase catalytic domain [Clostridia bacterium]|nr:family 78 glycoside hydrolase catalytic domain [Clostridia bacterium]